MRALAEGKLRWAFLPPGVRLPEDPLREGQGIWLGNVAGEEEGEEDRSEVESDESDSEELMTEDTLSTEDEEEEQARQEEGVIKVIGMGRFSALSLEEQDEIS